MKQMLNWALVTLLLQGCGELSYKRGASVKDLEQAKRDCMTAGDETIYQACMQKQGWMITPIDDKALFARASVTDIRAYAKPEEAVASGLQSATDNNKPSANKQLAIQKQAHATVELDANINTTPTPDDLTTYVISSWWKLGGTPQALKQDMNTCEAQLGSNHSPDSKAQVYTRAFAVCLYHKGWKGLLAK